jgi:hypothetical protein
MNLILASKIAVNLVWLNTQSFIHDPNTSKVRSKLMCNIELHLFIAIQKGYIMYAPCATLHLDGGSPAGAELAGDKGAGHADVVMVSTSATKCTITKQIMHSTLLD